MKSELERTKEALEVALGSLHASVGGYRNVPSAKATLDKIDAILNPPPEMEEVKIECWYVPSQPASKGFFTDLELAKRCCVPGEAPTCATVTYQQLKPQPKIQRVEVEVTWLTLPGGSYVIPCGDFDSKYLLNRKGHMTFEWEETEP